MSQDLQAEALQLINNARQTLQTLHNEDKDPKTMNNETTTTQTTAVAAAAPAEQLTQVANLYTSGQSIVQVAATLGITYGKARKLLAASGTPLRDSSERLKGRTRPIKQTEEINNA